MNRKQMIKVAAFLLIFAVLINCTGSLLIPKWTGPCYESVAQKEFYDLKKDSIDVLFLGSSQVSEGIAVPYLYDEYGISAYTIGSSSQPLQASYMWLKEARKTQDIEVAVLDVSRLYQKSPTEWYHKVLDNMKFSLDKARDLWDYCSSQEEADPFFSFISRIYMYHSRWNELTEEDFNIYEEDQNVFRGYFARKNFMVMDLDVMTYDNDEHNPRTKKIDYHFKYLEKLVEYCEEVGQELLLIKTPKYDWNIDKHEEVQAYADEHGLTFLDFSSRALLDEVGLLGETDFGDEEHLNILGSQKLTSWLGNYLKENYELHDYRGTKEGEKLQEEFDRCRRYSDIGEAIILRDVKKYFECMKEDRYDILIQLSSPDTGLYREDLTQMMQELGLTVDMTQLNGQRYLAWIQNGEVKYERAAESGFEFADQFGDGKGFRMYTDFYETATTKMRVDYEDITFSMRGLNILIYDNQLEKIMSNLTVYYDGASDSLKLAGK